MNQQEIYFGVQSANAFLSQAQKQLQDNRPVSAFIDIQNAMACLNKLEKVLEVLPPSIDEGDGNFRRFKPGDKML